MNKNLHSIGLMSGTSMDGVDASIIKSDGEQFIEIIENIYLKYDNQLKLELKKVVDSCKTKEDFNKYSKNIKEIEKKITMKHAEACKKIMEKKQGLKIDVIGFHGQTILHKPHKGYSIQIGDSNLLLNLTKVSIVSDFRNNDILNGGQGAPLTPLYHKLISLKIKSKFPIAFINIGGITNITYLENKNKIESFDSGPGNFLIDAWVKSRSKLDYDDKGKLAQLGTINENILKDFLSKPYYKEKFPKSLDVKEFNLNNIKKLTLEDGCSTLSMLTVKSICMAINSFKKKPGTIIFSGGGRKNKFIINSIKKILNKSVSLIDEFNFDGDFIESQAFAYLAIRSYLNKFITLPSTTGVKKPCKGGKILKFKGQ